MRFQLYQGDCLEVMKTLPDASIDLVLTDPPYGTTQSPWDEVIPFEPMWCELKRLIRPNRAIILFGGEPFSSRLRLSNLEMYKYDWKWRKKRPAGFVNAKLKPLKTYEDIMVFSDGKTSNGNTNNMLYNPQGLIKYDTPFIKTQRGPNQAHGENDYWRPSHDKAHTQEYTNYPNDVIEVGDRGDGKKVHPTQKPVALMEYLIRTYSHQGETVLDFTMGSGSTGVAAANTDRKFIGVEQSDKHMETAKSRIESAYNKPTLETFFE
jgi:site-specific DNA-methyltransferase (adenine-specific)